MNWHYQYNRHGELVGGIFQPKEKPESEITSPTDYEWRPVASWPRGTWFQERRNRQLFDSVAALLQGGK